MFHLGRAHGGGVEVDVVERLPDGAMGDDMAELMHGFQPVVGPVALGVDQRDQIVRRDVSTQLARRPPRIPAGLLDVGGRHSTARLRGADVVDPEVMTHDFRQVLDRRHRDRDMAVQTSGATQRQVDAIGEIRRRDRDDAVPWIRAVEERQPRVDDRGPVAVVVPVLAARAHRIELVEEQDERAVLGLLPPILEQLRQSSGHVISAPGGSAPIGICRDDDIDATLGGQRPREGRLAAAGGPGQQDSGSTSSHDRTPAEKSRRSDTNCMPHAFASPKPAIAESFVTTSFAASPMQTVIGRSTGESAAALGIPRAA